MGVRSIPQSEVMSIPASSFFVIEVNIAGASMSCLRAGGQKARYGEGDVMDVSTKCQVGVPNVLKIMMRIPEISKVPSTCLTEVPTS